MVSGLLAQGKHPGAALATAQVDPGILADDSLRVPIANYAALYNAVVRELQDEGLGLFPAAIAPGMFEFLCRGVLSSATLGEALERAARYLKLVLPDLEVTLMRGPHTASLSIAERRKLAPRAHDPRRVFAFEWLLRLVHGLACWLAGRGLALDHVRFPFPRPHHADDYALVYSEQVSFGAGHLVATFDAALLDLPARRDEADLEAFLEGAPGKISMLYRRDRETARALRDLLAADLAQPPTLDEAARRLKLTPRTLHRRLREEGASFRGIKAALRREAALAHLGRAQKGVAETAAELGYSEPSAFFRAFHGWTGETPSAYRQRHRPA